MKLSGTVALYTQLKYHENAVALTKRVIAMQEEFENEGKTEKKQVRRKRQPKALPYDGVIGKTNGLDETEA